MKRETIRRLNELNLAFYSAFSQEFSASRGAPWPGWTRMLDGLGNAPLGRVLDVGCGNARFARFLANQRLHTVSYVGIDACPALLEMARAQLADLEGITLELGDVVTEENIGALLKGRTFDLIAAFGLMHHVPGRAERARLVDQLAHHLVDGGHLVLAFWQFQGRARFEKKIVPWEAHNQRTAAPIALDDLEEGDHLLSWARGGHGVRYCHFASEAEIEMLAGRDLLERVDDYVADGETNDLNRYLVLRRSRRSPDRPRYAS